MKSKSRLPKFAPLPTTGPIVQADPFVWHPNKNGFPCWFRKPTASIKPFYTARVVASAEGRFQLPERIDFSKARITELRARANPWHPSGRLERLIVRLPWGHDALSFTLKFHGEGEQVECVAVETVMTSPMYKQVIGRTIRPDSKYKGPRAENDTKSAVSEKPRKRT